MVGSVAGPAGRKDSLPFGGWTLDTRAGTLSQHGQPAARLRPKTAAVLAELLATPGVVVARNVLLDRVWPGLAVTDDSITQCVAEIRRALGEDGPWLRTVPRRGYVMDLPVPALPGLPVVLGAGRRPPLHPVAIAASVFVLAGLAILLVADSLPLTSGPEGSHRSLRQGRNLFHGAGKRRDA